jgi:ubiquinone/menaquinone biosynthesis C-methylase UbiE
MGDSDRPLSWYAETLAREAAPRAVLDVGCTAGKSSRALKRAMPEARVEACDVAGPALALAHMRSVEAGLEITYTQCSAEALDYADDSFDLVSCHWLFHEMPPEAVRRALAEMRRVLRPGGVLAIYDMHLMPGGLVGAWLHQGYAARNNEPFAAAFSAMDLRAELAPLGFEEVAIDVSDLQRGEFDMGKLPPARTHFMTLATARVPR